MSDERQPFWVQCSDCEHTWIAAYTPMVMDRMALLLKGIRCPMCGADSKRIFLSEQKKERK